jgi:hypothetical protein
MLRYAPRFHRKHLEKIAKKKLNKQKISQKKISQKKFHKFSVIFFFIFFLAITVPQPIWSMPAKIWGV